VWTTDSSGNYVSALFGVVSGSSNALQSIESLFHQDLNGDGTIGVPASSSGVTLTFVDANSGLTSFTGSALSFEAFSTSSGQIVGFAGDGTSLGSDQIDLQGMNYNSLHSSYNNSTGVLALTDGTHTVDLQFLGNYSQSNFLFANAGDGGTIVYAQTGSSQPSGSGGGSPVPIEVAGSNNSASVASQDTFIFAPNFGQTSLAHFTPATDTIQISSTVFANVAAVLAATHDDGHGNAVITDAAHDTITIPNVTTAQLLAHQGDFHIV
jgi:serralysin